MGIEILPRQSEQESRAALLASDYYNPTTAVDVEAGGGGIGDVDSVTPRIVQCTFTVPASGKVRVTLNALTDTRNASSRGTWMIREGSTIIAQAVVTVPRTSDQPRNRATAIFEVSGLTPGSVKTWKWSQQNLDGQSINTQMGGSWGPASMEVYDAGVTTLGYMTGGVWNGPQAINVGSPNNTGLVVVGASGQVSNLQEWKDSAGVVRSSIDKDGRATTMMRGYRAKGTNIVVSTNNDAPIIQAEDSAYGAPCAAVNGAEIGIRIDAAGIWSVDWLAVRSAGATGGRTWMRLKTYASAAHPFGVASGILAAHEITQHAEDHFSLSYTGYMSTGVHRFEFYQESGGNTTMNSFAQLTYHGPL